MSAYRYDTDAPDEIYCTDCERAVEAYGSRKQEHAEWCPQHPEAKPLCEWCEHPRDLVDGLCVDCRADIAAQENEALPCAA